MAVELYINQAVDWILTLSPLKIYIIFGFVSYLENIIPPIPGDLLVVYGGYLAAEQIVGFSPLLMITTLTSVAGFMNMYMVGAHFGDKIEEHRSRFWLMRLVDVKYYDKVKLWMQRWGQGVIVANRFLAGTRSVISLASGVSKTPVSLTILSSVCSSLVWNFVLLSLGWIVHENWKVIGHYLEIYGRIILILLFAIVVGVLLYRRYPKWNRRLSKKNNKKG